MQLNYQGIILLNKPQDWTSFDVVAKSRGILATRKVGHSGTLDPMATGVLPLFLGRATKAVDMQIVQDKEYIAKFKLGMNTDTGDITGEVINTREINTSKDEVLYVINSFQGEIEQYPPMYSAVKINGQPLYKLARQGITVERKLRKVTIHSIEFLNSDDENYEYTIKVLCSKGTYIRSLVEDIGEKLGCGAVLTALERTKACGYSIEDCITLEDLQKSRDNNDLQSLVLEIDTVFNHLPEIHLTTELAKRLLNGARSSISKPNGQYRVYYNNKFYAVGEVKEKKLFLVKLFVEKEKEELDAGSL